MTDRHGTSSWYPRLQAVGSPVELDEAVPLNGASRVVPEPGQYTCAGARWHLEIVVTRYFRFIRRSLSLGRRELHNQDNHTGPIARATRVSARSRLVSRGSFAHRLHVIARPRVRNLEPQIHPVHGRPVQAPLPLAKAFQLTRLDQS